MAFSASTVWEVRTTGNDANGGGYSSGGVDYSQQDAAQVALTDMVIDGTTNTIFSSATLGSNSNYIGNIINVTGGTGFTVQRVQIVSRSGANYTVDKSLGTLGSTGGTGNLGGALAGIQKALDLITVAGMSAYVKATATYSISTKLSSAADIGNFYNRNRVIGYTTTRGDRGQVTIQTSAAVQGLGVTQSGMQFENFIFDGNNTGTVGVTGTGNYAFHFDNVQVKNFTSHGFSGGNNVCFNCRANNNGGAGFNGPGWAVGCVAHNNTGNGIESARILNCLSYANGGDGLRTSGFGGMCCNSTSYGNTGDGIEIYSYYSLGVVCSGNICYGNGGYGIRGAGSSPAVASGLCYNALGNNTSGARGSVAAGIGEVALTADPFTNAASGDFSLNNTAGGGAACRAAGFPGAFPGGTTTGYLDIGAVQHQDSGGGSSGMLFIPNLDGV